MITVILGAVIDAPEEPAPVMRPVVIALLDEDVVTSLSSAVCVVPDAAGDFVAEFVFDAVFEAVAVGVDFSSVAVERSGNAVVCAEVLIANRATVAAK
jgi:hypothetical protein